MKQIIVEIKNGYKCYGRKKVLSNINLVMKGGDFISIIGASGCGKSTLLNIIGCMESFDSGTYKLCDQEILYKKDYYALRSREIGFVFQNYNLIPNLSCLDNIILPSLYSNKEMFDVHVLMSKLKINHLQNTLVNVLSGGEKQRVALARAFVLKPSLIIADEPTGNLDEHNSQTVMKVLQDYINDDTALLVVTHDSQIASMANRVYELKDGMLYEKE